VKQKKGSVSHGLLPRRCGPFPQYGPNDGGFVAQQGVSDPTQLQVVPFSVQLLQPVAQQAAVGQHRRRAAIAEATDALVRVRHTAICGADLLPFRGLTPGFEYGTVLGHEFVGTVVEVGSEVRRIKRQQRVV